MLGQWQSQTRRLNRHYQSVSGGIMPGTVLYSLFVDRADDSEPVSGPYTLNMNDGIKARNVKIKVTRIFNHTGGNLYIPCSAYVNSDAVSEISVIFSDGGADVKKIAFDAPGMSRALTTTEINNLTGNGWEIANYSTPTDYVTHYPFGIDIDWSGAALDYESGVIELSSVWSATLSGRVLINVMSDTPSSGYGTFRALLEVIAA